MPANNLVLDDVVVSLGQRELARIDTVIAPGEIFTVMGPSGSGKSTLLAFVAGFLDPVFCATGRVLCGVRDITDLPPDKRKVGLLFQDALLFPHMSVGENLMFAIRAGGTTTARQGCASTSFAAAAATAAPARFAGLDRAAAAGLHC